MNPTTDSEQDGDGSHIAERSQVREPLELWQPVHSLLRCPCGDIITFNPIVIVSLSSLSLSLLSSSDGKNSEVACLPGISKTWAGTGTAWYDSVKRQQSEPDFHSKSGSQDNAGLQEDLHLKGARLIMHSVWGGGDWDSEN